MSSFWVMNASALISLARIGRLDLLEAPEHVLQARSRSEGGVGWSAFGSSTAGVGRRVRRTTYERTDRSARR